jgi:hypothetical protein
MFFILLLFPVALATKWCEENPDTSCIKTTTCTCTGTISREGWYVLAGVLTCFLSMCLFVCCSECYLKRKAKSSTPAVQITSTQLQAPNLKF